MAIFKDVLVRTAKCLEPSQISWMLVRACVVSKALYNLLVRCEITRCKIWSRSGDLFHKFLRILWPFFFDLLTTFYNVPVLADTPDSSTCVRNYKPELGE